MALTVSVPLAQALSEWIRPTGRLTPLFIRVVMNTSPPRPHLVGLLAGLFLAVGISFASVVLARTWVHLRESQVITVTGSARKNIRSDLVVWTGVLSVEDRTLPGAHAKFQSDFEKVRAFLVERGQRDLSLSPVQVKDLTRRKRDASDDEAVSERVGYQLSQAIQISSPDVEGVPRLAADCLGLMAQDVVLQTVGIQFIYTKAGETKVTMMAEATEDARRRAEEIATRGGRQVKELRSARMGVVQVNPLHGTATSWEGNNDTQSLEKTITSTVSAEFSLR